MKNKRHRVYGFLCLFILLLGVAGCKQEKESTKDSVQKESGIVESKVETKSNAATIIVEDSSQE